MQYNSTYSLYNCLFLVCYAEKNIHGLLEMGNDYSTITVDHNDGGIVLGGETTQSLLFTLAFIKSKFI